MYQIIKVKIKLVLKINLLFVLLGVRIASGQTVAEMDFSNAKIVNYTANSRQDKAAIQLLTEEIAKRSGTEFIVEDRMPPDHSSPLIIVGTSESLQRNHPQGNPIAANDVGKPDGFQIQYLAESRALYIIGNDSRGLLFGVGYFLRKAELRKGVIQLPANMEASTAPVVEMRGHQLGYRPKVNSYDGFTVEMFEQYIRDLIVFGTNAIELMPPKTDDASDSPMFPLPQFTMMVKVGELLAKYGLDTWIWYPQIAGDYGEEANVRAALAESEEIFSKVPKINAVFVPGGDPGDQKPSALFSYLARMATILHKYHPDAEIWVSPQGFSGEQMTEFLELVKQEPAWLSGIAHGPWINVDINGFRERIPPRYPIRRYPDITHTLDAQYFMPDWDYAFAATHHREPINPRPVDQAAVFHSAELANYEGFITYSEGVNDDVNKIIWSSLGWNPNADILDVLRDYSRYFIGADYADDFAHGLLNLEENWRGPLLTNTTVHSHHLMFQQMESSASPEMLLNWRFQQALYRSYYDAYTRSRLIYETQLEESAMQALRRARERGALASMNLARSILDRSKEQHISPDWRLRIFELASALFQSTRAQLSVRKYFAIDTIRGANLDLVDYPLNDRLWLEAQFDRISKIDSEEGRLQEIAGIVNWQNPGPGGFYDDLGNIANQPHLVRNLDYEKDPNGYFTPFIGHAGAYSIEFPRSSDWRVSSKTYMQTLYGFPLEMRYTGLDPTARYRVKVTYVEEERINLTADDNYPVHNYLTPPNRIEPLEFDIPWEATQDGTLSLKWRVESKGSGPGRGCSVAEVWLMKI